MYIIALKYVVLDTLAKLRKTAISLGISSCPSVRPHGTTRLSLDGFSYGSYESALSLNHADKIQVWLKSDERIRRLTLRPQFAVTKTT